MNTEQQDDQVFLQLFKKGAKDSPSSELDRKILDYAAKKNTPVYGSSHFSGGWKVPLSLVASVLLVFTILVQLDQSPEQLEIPPFPTMDKAEPQSIPMDGPKTDGIKDSMGDGVGVDRDIGFESENLPTQEQSTTTQSEHESRKKFKKQGALPSPETVQEKSRQVDDFKLNNELKMESAPSESPSASSSSAKSKAANAPAAEKMRPNKSLERMQESSKDSSSEKKESTIQNDSRSETGAASESVAPERSIGNESNQRKQAQESVMQPREDAPMAEEDLDFTPLPVENWLLLIEQLLAKKDYAEAARQLAKFKQAHPKVNVEELESKIP